MQNDLNTLHRKTLDQFLQGPNFALTQQYYYETEKDRITHRYINLILKVLTNFIYNWYYATTKEYLPFCDNWLPLLCQKFQEWMPLIRRIRRPISPPEEEEEEDAGEGPSGKRRWDQSSASLTVLLFLRPPTPD
nr:MAG: pTP protein [Blackbird siadenovirus]